MNYQIKYNARGEAKHVTAGKRRLKFAGYVLLLIGVCAGVVWCAGGDWGVTVGALETMATELKQGSGFSEALSTFCIAVMQGAELG